MNNEVNLILTKLKIVSEEKENGMYLCNKKHSKALLDYITNLQKENERFKKRNEEIYNGFLATNQELCDKSVEVERLETALNASKKFNKYLQKENIEFASRCDKAIEYIKKNTHEYKMFNKELGHFSNLTNISIDKNNKIFIDDLLKILGDRMTEVPKCLYEVMKENGDLDENDMYHGNKVIPITPIPDGFEIKVGDEEAIENTLDRLKSLKEGK